MDLVLLTKSTSPILGPIAQVLGYIMEGIFTFTSWFGIENIGLCIILFTIIVNLLMLPMTIKQQKVTKLTAVMNPELQAISKKYKGKKDNESLMKQQEETRAVYEKYGTSPTGGCLPLLVQLPIMFALYRVIYNIPAYVSSVRIHFASVANAILQVPNYSTIQGFVDLVSKVGMKIENVTTENTVIDFLYKLDQTKWDSLAQAFAGNAGVEQAISQNVTKIMHMNQFLGVNLINAPGFRLTPALIIPILAGLSQWFSTKLLTANTTADTSQDTDNPMASSMKTMNNVMPLMSVFFCISLPACIGIYWVASSVVRVGIQLIINAYMKKVDVNDLIQKNLEKSNKKRAKKGLPPQKVISAATINARSIQTEQKEEPKMSESEKAEKIKKATQYYNSDEAKPGSIASKAGMVQKYNEKNNKK